MPDKRSGMAAKKNKYYVVWQGHNPGIYHSWEDCQAQIKGVAGAQYKAFESKVEAETAFKKSYWEIVGHNKKPSGGGSVTKKSVPKSQIIWDSISVDAACSGNPGVMEYQGVDTRSKQQIFHKKYNLGTNNIGEFLAIVHALALFQKTGQNTKPIYTDSVTAIKWVKQKKAKTQLEHNAKTAELYDVIARAEAWLKNNTYQNPIIKWETEDWGEVPADFGRK